MDYNVWYSRISAPFRSPQATRALRIADKAAAFVLAAAYIISLLYLAATVNPLFWKAVAVPLITFVVVTMFRMLLNSPRPYEEHDSDPLIMKDSAGNSFPSRHISSAVIIALELTWLFWPYGLIAWLPVLVLIFTRIVGGVHYPKDVLAGIAFALGLGLLGFYVI